MKSEEKTELTNEWETYYCSNVKYFQTSGKVSSSLGIPIFRLPGKSKYDMPDGEKVQLPQKNYKQALDDIYHFVEKILP